MELNAVAGKLPTRKAKQLETDLRGHKVESLAAHGLICEVQTISPDDAARWLKANKHNRPLRRGHVNFLAKQITAGQWQLNGQAIVVSDKEDILDGQHRLHAIIEAGIAITTLVLYGISYEAFKTIDTGSMRTGADALALWHPEAGRGHSKAISSAVKYCRLMENKFRNDRSKMSNTDVLAYVHAHKTMWRFAETVAAFPVAGRCVSLALALACYEIFARKDEETADQFIRDLCTGEQLTRTDPVYVLRNLLIRDAQRAAHYPQTVRLKMVVKAWNLRRRGREANTGNAIMVRVDDPERMEII